ncbi:MAG: EAL domain-containing protein [Pseudomonadota bacterium]
MKQTASTQPTSSPAQPRVLVVDDDATLRLLMREALEGTGLEVLEADNGEDGLALFEAWQPALVLLDVELPTLNGFDLCRQLRATPAGSYVPVVMVTGLDDVRSVEHAYEAGATDFIAKPVNWAVLAHRVRYILRAGANLRTLQKSQADNQAMLLAIPDALFRLHRDGSFIGAGSGPHAEAISRIVTGPPGAGQAVPEKTTDEQAPLIDTVFRSGGIATFEYSLPMNGKSVHFEARLVASRNNEALAVVRDITKRKQAEHSIHYKAHYDDLTGLANRRQFRDLLDVALNEAEQASSEVAVMFLDLDRFKIVNDSLGHTAGDKLIQRVADRLRRCLRSSDVLGLNSEVADPGRPVIARIGGDEFTVVLRPVGAAANPESVARRIIEELSTPFVIDGHELFVTPSIGIAVSPHDGNDADALLRHADTAMYQAKADGRNTFKRYQSTMHGVKADRLSLESDLRKALDNGELSVVYQPQLRLDNMTVTGLEALMRWNHPVRGAVSPGEFIPVAEETGLTVPMGEFVLHTVATQHQRWVEEGLAPTRIAVNVSAAQFHRCDLVGQVRRVVNSTGIDPRFLEVEVTEGTVMRDVDVTVQTLRALRALGLKLSVDDFGTGYSSLSYLKEFPLDTLKIDQKFVREIDVQNNASIVTAIIAMAKGLQLEVIAEGVETESQLEFLRAAGCDGVQGFLLGRPSDADTVAGMLKQFEAAAV